MRTATMRLLSSVAIVAVSSTAQAQCGYNVQIIYGPKDWVSLVVNDMNSSKTVVGWYGLPPSQDLQPFSWSENTGFVALPKPPGAAGGNARCINDLGQIAGHARMNGMSWLLTQLAVWTDGVAEVPEPLPGPPNAIEVQAINDFGQVVGTLVIGSLAPTPILWQDGSYLSLATELVGEGVNTFLYDITNSGWYGGSWHDTNSGAKSAFIAGPRGDVAFLPTPENFINMQVRHLSERLHAGVDGAPFINKVQGPKRAFYWNGATMTLIDLPAPLNAAASTSINCLGQAIGVARQQPQPEGFKPMPYIWQDGVTTDLRTKVTLPQYHHINTPRKITDDGVIVADGYNLSSDTVFYLLTPQTVDEDVNTDCSIDARDLEFVLESWGPTEEALVKRADIDKDGWIGGTDLAYVLGAWSPRERSR